MLPATAVRALSCFQEAVALCNLSDDEGSWPMLYCNAAWCSTTGAWLGRAGLGWMEVLALQLWPLQRAGLRRSGGGGGVGG